MVPCFVLKFNFNLFYGDLAGNVSACSCQCNIRSCRTRGRRELSTRIHSNEMMGGMLNRGQTNPDGVRSLQSMTAQGARQQKKKYRREKKLH